MLLPNFSPFLDGVDCIYKRDLLKLTVADSNTEFPTVLLLVKDAAGVILWKIHAGIFFERLDGDTFPVKRHTYFLCDGGNVKHALAHQRQDIVVEVVHVKPLEVGREFNSCKLLPFLVFNQCWSCLVTHVVREHLGVNPVCICSNNAEFA